MSAVARPLVLLLLFSAAAALLPWLLRRWQQRRGAAAAAGSGALLRVLSAVAVGPQQRVLLLEAGPGDARVWLLVGVTAQQLSCLQVLPASVPAAGAQAPAFAHAVARALAEPENG